MGGRARSIAPAVLAVLPLTLAATEAGAQAFISRSAFVAALPGAANSLNFDSLAAGTLIASGGANDMVGNVNEWGGDGRSLERTLVPEPIP